MAWQAMGDPAGWPDVHENSRNRGDCRTHLRLTLLAPDIIMAILDGKEPSGLSLGKLTKTLPLDWVEQRNLLGFPAMWLELFVIR